MTASLRVIRAAAGCGKTTALAVSYLELVAAGVPVERIVAITFTRRAAAELVQRVGLTLRAAAGDASALARLGDAGPLYLAAAPTDRELALTALADLGSAPIGTTDHFVNLLLAEFALLAELPLPDGRVVPLDTGLVAVPDLSAHLEASARRLVDPPDSAPPDEVLELTRYLSLGEIVEAVARPDETDGLPAASCGDVLAWLATRTAERLQDVDLHGAFKLPPTADRAAWRDALAQRTNKGAEWTLDAVAAWLADGGTVADAPRALVPWIRKIHKGRLRPLRDALSDAVFDFGITRVRMDHVLDALRHPYEDPSHLALADVLRAALDRLRVRVVADALENAALQGELPHRELTRAAAHLARSPALHGRFGALLVDEFQDASPDQLLLYEAIAAQPGMRSVFVGDGRQSIYLFRGGEPEGLARLTVEQGPHHLVEDLMTNRRSTPELVDAHQALFDALEAPMLAERLAPLDPLDGLGHDPARAGDSLDAAVHAIRAPVVLVGDANVSTWEADDGALGCFWERVQAAWREPGRGADTAAVLCPTWRKAREARDRLRELSGDPDVAWVEGGDGWLEQGVARDVSAWLRALLDRTDDIAWLAVWKHPSIGLTDGAFARILAGVGLPPEPPHLARLGQVCRADALLEPHRPDDRAAFARAAPALRDAQHAIGRDDTSLVLDRLFTALSWRTVLAAGPGGADEVARLEVLLDWIGDLDAQGVGVDAISQMLRSPSRMEAPRVRLERPERTIACTTVFQSKGLAWDHVAVLSPGRGGRLAIDPDVDCWMDLDGQRVRLLGLRFDPEGGLVPYHDPLRRLAVRIQESRYAEEGARLAYVAVTRARRSVTIGVPTDHGRSSMAQKLVAKAWAGVEHPQIAHVPPPGGARRSSAMPSRSVVPAVPAMPAVPEDREPRWTETAPSASAARFTREHRQRIAAHVVHQVRLGQGFAAGEADLPPPRRRHPHLTPADWGTLAHGWFARWRFDGPARPDAIGAWLAEEWGADDPDVRTWLAAISTRIREVRGPVWEIVKSVPDRDLHFEYPVVGVGGPEDRLLLSGRMDLLVVRPKGVVIVDFKAGDKSPTGLHDLEERASLGTYGPQLDSYRTALQRMGMKVDAVALWFVRTGASVVW